MRCCQSERNTGETAIQAAINLDGNGQADICSEIGFFNHMMELFAFHSGFDIVLSASGDEQVDDHHLIEDAGIVLGQLLRQALGDKRGIARYGSFRIVMDESLAQVDLDISGRPYLVFDAQFHRPMIGAYATEMTEEFMRALAFNAGITLHMHVTGKNDHHQIEALFKALGRALKQAVRIESDQVPSSKGVIE